MPVIFEIITSPNCPHSPRAVRIAQSLVKDLQGISFQEISMITGWGQEIAQRYHVNATPTLVVNGKVVFVGVPGKKALSQILADEMKREQESRSYYF